MFDWLQKLINSLESEKSKNKPSATTNKFHDMPSQPQREDNTKTNISADVEPIKPKVKDPIYVRGRYWKNTEEDRWDLPNDLDELHDSTIEELIGELERIGRAEIRRDAAKSLGQSGAIAAPAIPALIKTAVDRDKDVRMAAQNALCAIDPNWSQNSQAQQSVPHLITALKNQPPEVINTATDLLIQIGTPTVPSLVNELLVEDMTGKVYILRVLARVDLSSTNIISELMTVLESQNTQVRIAAAETLATIGPTEETIPILIAGLADPFPNVRKAMAKCLGQAGTLAEPALPVILPLLADKNHEVRKAATEATRLIGPEAVPALTELVGTHDLERFKAWLTAQEKVLDWLNRVENHRQQNMILDPCKYLMNLNWTAYDILEEQECLELAQEAAIIILGELGEDALSAIPNIIDASKDPNPKIRRAAVQALGKIGEAVPTEPKIVSALIPTMVDSNKYVRNASIETMQRFDCQRISDPAVTKAITELSANLDNSDDIAVNAFSAIGAASLPTLVETLNSGNRVSRQNAAKALGMIGPKAKDSIPYLTEALQDSHRWVQAEAEKSLAKIRANEINLNAQS